jgi:hypothetical protein
MTICAWLFRFDRTRAAFEYRTLFDDSPLCGKRKYTKGRFSVNWRLHQRLREIFRLIVSFCSPLSTRAFCGDAFLLLSHVLIHVRHGTRFTQLVFSIVHAHTRTPRSSRDSLHRLIHSRAHQMSTSNHPCRELCSSLLLLLSTFDVFTAQFCRTRSLTCNNICPHEGTRKDSNWAPWPERPSWYCSSSLVRERATLINMSPNASETQ